MSSESSESTESGLTWVIGSGGLLGRSLGTALEHGWSHKIGQPGSSAHLWRPSEPIVWSAPGAGVLELRKYGREFLRAAGGRPWTVAWCAGVGVMGTSQDALRLELSALWETLETLGAGRPGDSQGVFFFASSAGGVYAGVGAPPYDESSPVRPLAPYGQAKLDGEALVAAWSQQTGIPSLIGRIANLYGPGQNLAKSQGLISQICRSHFTGQPVSIYVSLDTLRDYLFAPDCAGLIVQTLARLRRESSAAGPASVTKIMASQRAITIGAVLGEMRRIFKRSPRIVLGASASSAVQAGDLSLRSRIWPDLDRRPLTPFPVGVATTAADLRRRMQVGWSVGSGSGSTVPPADAPSNFRRIPG